MIRDKYAGWLVNQRSRVELRQVFPELPAENFTV